MLWHRVFYWLAITKIARSWVSRIPRKDAQKMIEPMANRRCWAVAQFVNMQKGAKLGQLLRTRRKATQGKEWGDTSSLECAANFLVVLCDKSPTLSCISLIQKMWVLFHFTTVGCWISNRGEIVTHLTCYESGGDCATRCGLPCVESNLWL